jgi:23S rRNA (guanine745-N1)-methyltransferase
VADFARFLICPVCDEPLSQIAGALRCPQAHAFDLARAGYSNLLLATRKQPATVGDTKEMLQARRRFLERGYYQPLLDVICRHVDEYLDNPPGDSNDTRPIGVVEAGCGDGYYIGQVQRMLADPLKPRDVCCFGVDISKEADKRAAKHYPAVHFMVADIHRKLYFASGSVQILLNIFAPRNAAEFGRVLMRQGRLLVVTPGSDHLANLRERFNLIGIEDHKQQRVIAQLAGLFQLTGKQLLTYDLTLNGEALLDLIQMTPNYWHLSAETREQISSIERVVTPASFSILQFRRVSSQEPMASNR